MHSISKSLACLQEKREREREKSEGRRGRGGPARAERKGERRRKTCHVQRRTDRPSVDVLRARTQKKRKETQADPKRRKGEEEGGRGEKKRKAGPEKPQTATPRSQPPKTLRQSLHKRAVTMHPNNRNHSKKSLQHKIRVRSPKPSEHKP